MAKIAAIRCIRTRADGTWTIVKVETDRPGLYGIGSASDHYHGAAVIAAIEQSLAPPPDRAGAGPYRGHLAVGAAPAATGATTRS